MESRCVLLKNMFSPEEYVVSFHLNTILIPHDSTGRRMLIGTGNLLRTSRASAKENMGLLNVSRSKGKHR